LINAGGDLYCLGQNLDKNWAVGIRDPRNKKNVLVTEELVNEAVATSGDYEQFFEHKGLRYSHIVDPRTGFPPEREVISASVITKNCTTADSLSTAFVVMGIEAIEEFLEKVKSSMRIYVMSEDEEGLAVRIFK
jgi:thiamine biosynthesis lipoprotein